MGMNILDAMRDPAAFMSLRLASQNARHMAAKVGVARIRAEGLSPDQIREAASASPRGFYSWVVQMGYDGLARLRDQMIECAHVPMVQPLGEEFRGMEMVDRLFGGFKRVSTQDVLGLKVSAYPGLNELQTLRTFFPQQYERFLEVKALLEQNMATPTGQPSPVKLLEDHPGWASETPDIRNIRGNMAEAVVVAQAEGAEIEQRVNERYGEGTMAKIENVVLLGIGANDMYWKDLAQKVNSDPASRRKIHVIFEPGQLENLPADVNANNTLFVAISRGGGTQETVKSAYFAKKEGRMKYLVGYANKGLLKEFVDQERGILLPLDKNIGGRYMWAKGKIVLVPLSLVASEGAFKEYTDAMVDFDNKFWPVGPDQTILQLAGHLYMYLKAYNIPGLFACSNQAQLDAGLRQLFQLHNEAVGKIHNGTIAYGAGMEMQPFAHAGADGLLGAAISALVYGVFVFDTSYKYDPATNAALAAADLLDKEADHVGLTKELLGMACVFPNQAKFTYAGAPSLTVAMNGTSYRNLATLTALYQNLMYPYLIMNETNPDSNPNVQMVRDTTGRLISDLCGMPAGDSPIDVIQRAIPGIMRG